MEIAQLGSALLGRLPEATALEPVKLPLILSRVCSLSSANYFPNPFGILLLTPRSQPNGPFTFKLKPEFYNGTGYHDMLQWSLKYISGNFQKGKLEGKALLISWRGVIIYASFTNGELHGPLHSYGRKFLFDFEVFLKYIYFDIINGQSEFTLSMFFWYQILVCMYILPSRYQKKNSQTSF